MTYTGHHLISDWNHSYSLVLNNSSFMHLYFENVNSYDINFRWDIFQFADSQQGMPVKRQFLPQTRMPDVFSSHLSSPSPGYPILDNASPTLLNACSLIPSIFYISICLLFLLVFIIVFILVTIWHLLYDQYLLHYLFNFHAINQSV